MKRIVESPLGKILQAIRENEVRAEAVGYNVPRFKLLAFVIGGAFSGLAGVLYAMLFGIVPLEAISFVFSGNVVFATLIGGSGSLYGPVIGSFVFIWLSESVSTLWARWPLLLGVAFVIVVLFLRGGVVEAWTRFWTWRSSKHKSLTKSFGALTRRERREPRRSRRARCIPSSAPTARARPRCSTCSPAPSRRPRDRSFSTGRTSPARPPRRVAHLGLARSYQRTTVFPAFSLLDNVWVAAFATGKSWQGLLLAQDRVTIPKSAERARQALADVGLDRKWPQSWRARSPTASSASSSSPSRSPRRRACCCSTSPPRASRPRRRASMVALVRALKGRYTIVLIEHKIDIIMSVSDRISVMHFGSLIAEGTPQEIQKNAEVRRAYLGGVAA